MHLRKLRKKKTAYCAGGRTKELIRQGCQYYCSYIYYTFGKHNNQFRQLKNLNQGGMLMN